jgi:predicted RNA polymerase sigma factor
MRVSTKKGVTKPERQSSSAYRRALEWIATEPERRFLERRLAEVERH